MLRVHTLVQARTQGGGSLEDFQKRLFFPQFGGFRSLEETDLVPSMSTNLTIFEGIAFPWRSDTGLIMINVYNNLYL
jgi:hypothetical protein